MADYPEVVSAAFNLQHGDPAKSLSGAQRMNLRSDIARGMVSGQYSHIVGELERKAMDDHEKELNQWNLFLTDISEAEDVSRCVPFPDPQSIASLCFHLAVLAIPSSMPYILFSVQLAYMRIVTFRSSLVTLRRTNLVTCFSLRRLTLSSILTYS